MRSPAFFRILLGLAALALLEAACRIGWVSPMTIIPPTAMAAATIRLLARHDTYLALLWTVSNVLAAIVAALLIGGVAAVLIHRRRAVRRALDPFLASSYAVPLFVLYPIFVAILGLNRWPLVLIGFVFAVPGMAIAMLDGLDGVPPIVFKMARLYRLGDGAALIRLILPSMAPAIFSGAKLTVAYSFIGIIAGEFILADRGLGFAIADSYNRFDNQTMYGMMVLVLGLVIAVNGAVHAAEDRIRRRWERR